jgi:hypothetical protein
VLKLFEVRDTDDGEGEVDLFDEAACLLRRLPIHGKYLIYSK